MQRPLLWAPILTIEHHGGPNVNARGELEIIAKRAIGEHTLTQCEAKWELSCLWYYIKYGIVTQHLSFIWSKKGKIW